MRTSRDSSASSSSSSCDLRDVKKNFFTCSEATPADIGTNEDELLLDRNCPSKPGIYLSDDASGSLILLRLFNQLDNLFFSSKDKYFVFDKDKSWMLI